LTFGFIQKYDIFVENASEYIGSLTTTITENSLF